MDKKFAYTSEDDKCYGLTGMVISLNVFDNESMLKELSLDNAHGESISFTPDFFFNSNPRFSAKIAWNEMIKQYQLLTAMVIGNIMCRYTVGQKKALTQENIKDIHGLIEDEGHDICSLEDDEIDMIFDKTFNYMSQIYSDRQTHSLARNFVTIIKQRRTMSGDEVNDELQILRRY